MNIVFDLDETLFESNVIIDVINKYNIPLTRSDIKTWDLVEVPEFCRKEIKERWSLPDYMCNLKPCNGAKQMIYELYRNGHELYCVTSRDSKIERETKEMVRKVFPEIKETFVVNGPKIEKLNDLNAELFFDDGPHHCIDANCNNIPTIMISNRHTPYNHHMRNSIKWIKKIADINIGDLTKDDLH